MAYGAEKRLADLGIVVGSRIRVVRKAPFGGPIEVEVAGSRFLIGMRVAERSVVEFDGPGRGMGWTSSAYRELAREDCGESRGYPVL